MAESIFQMQTDYSTENGLILPEPGVAVVVIGRVVTEHIRPQLEARGDFDGFDPGDGAVLVSPQLVVSSARSFLEHERWRRRNPELARQEDLPQLILPGNVDFTIPDR